MAISKPTNETNQSRHNGKKQIAENLNRLCYSEISGKLYIPRQLKKDAYTLGIVENLKKDYRHSND